jgi:CSLREA domain-containing protein
VNNHKTVRFFALTLLSVLLFSTLQACGLIETIFTDPLAAALDEACEEAPFEVTTEDDTNDGICTSDDCSLREAIITANYCPGEQRVIIPPGDYEIQAVLDGESSQPGGSLVINQNSVEIQGFDISGGRNINITGPTLDDPIFIVRGEYVALHISSLFIGDCQVAIRNEGNNVFLDNVLISRCTTAGIQAVGPYPSANVPGVFLENSVISTTNIGIQSSGGWTSLHGTRISGTDDYGIFAQPESPSTHLKLTLYDSSIYGNSGTGVVVEGETDISFSSISGNVNENCQPVSGLLASGKINIWASTIGDNGRLCDRDIPGAILEPDSHSGYTINYATIARNYGIGLQTASDLTMHASIVANNTLADCAFNGGTVISEGFNLDSDNSCNLAADGDMPNTDPNLDFLSEITSSSGTTTIAYAPMDGSPVINAVTEPCSGPDQKHDLRPIGDDCDIGAIEAGGSTSLPITVGTPESDLDPDLPTGHTTGPTTCRFGPSTVYAPIGYLTEDQSVNLLARTHDNEWLLVESVDGIQTQCWVDRDLLDLDSSLDLGTLEVGQIPPTPTWTPMHTDTPEPQQQGCLWYDANQNVVCFASCPVDPANSLGACTP